MRVRSCLCSMSAMSCRVSPMSNSMSSRMGLDQLRHALTQTFINMFARIGDFLRNIQNEVVVELDSGMSSQVQ